MKHKIVNTIIGALSTSGLVVVAPDTAHAEHLGRDGFTFGVALGGGNLGCSGEGCDDFVEAGSLDAHIGGMITPQVAGVFETWWMVHSEDRVSIDQTILTGGTRFWPVNHFWLQGGLGVARTSFQYDGVLLDVEDHSEWVPAFQVGIGVEPVASEDFGLDLALRYGTGFYAEGDSRIHNGSLTLGISFY
jgi:hypothetical protein